MSRRVRKNNNRRWIGIVLLFMVISAAVIVLIDYSKNDKETAVMPSNIKNVYSTKGLNDYINDVEYIEKTTKMPDYSKRENIQLINEENPNDDMSRPNNLLLLKDVFGDEVSLQIPEGSIEANTAYAAKRMFIDSQETIDDKYIITSAYRSASYQQELYEDYIDGNNRGAFEKVLPAYASEHPTGTAIDILSEDHNVGDEAFYYTNAGQWLKDNAHKYGFILRYPKDKEEITGVTFEPWHYRYIGVEAATEIYENGLCLEEYLNYT